jgi:phosphoribosylcarboxyaminoimidazole (NCAIR) mutase
MVVIVFYQFCKIPGDTVAIINAQNTGILASQMLAIGYSDLIIRVLEFNRMLDAKIVKANEELKKIK